MNYSEQLEKVDVYEAADRLEELIDSFAEGHEPYLLTEEGEPRMVLLSYELFETATAIAAQRKNAESSGEVREELDDDTSSS